MTLVEEKVVWVLECLLTKQKLKNSPASRKIMLIRICRKYSGSTKGFNELHESMGFLKIKIS